MRSLYSQLELFEDNAWRKTFQLIPKLPYSFSYRFQDTAGKISELQVLDWEVGALYWNCLKATKGDESKALGKVRNKYFDEFQKTDLHFFWGLRNDFTSLPQIHGSLLAYSQFPSTYDNASCELCRG